MVFCYQNCSDLLWEKKSSSNLEKTFEIRGWSQEFSKKLRSLEQFLETVKGQNNFGNGVLYWIVPGGFS